MDHRGLGAGRLIRRRMRTELCGKQQRHLVGSRGTTPVVGTAAAALLAFSVAPRERSSPAAAANISGCAVKDTRAPPHLARASARELKIDW